MAAPLGFKTFTVGEVLSAADVNGYLMQGVLVFATTAARDAAITSPQEGQFAFTKDTNSLFYYDGAAWVASGATGDIEGVTAGVGISGGGTSGTVTVTNSMATAITSNGDLIYGTGSGTFTRRAIGSTNDVLTVSGGIPTWAAPAAGGTTLLQSLSLSGSSVTSSTFSSAYTQILVYIKGMYINSGTVDTFMRLNGDTGSNYGYRYIRAESNNTFFSSAANPTSSFEFGGANNSSTVRNTSNGLITITRPSDTDQVFLAAQFLMYDGSGYRAYDSVGVYDSSAAITNLTIYQSATFSGGTAEIYGVK